MSLGSNDGHTRPEVAGPNGLHRRQTSGAVSDDDETRHNMP